MGNNAWQPIVLQSRPAGAHEFLDVESAGRELLGASAASLRVRETAHVSMRFATDLQDDLLDLSLFGSRCQIGVAQPDGPAMPRLTLLAQHKTGKHGVAILYQRVAPAPAEPAGGPRGKKSAAAVEGAVPTTVRRYGAPYFQVDMSDASSSSSSVETTVRLRPFRVLHKLIGGSSRIDWVLAHKGPLVCSFYQGTAGLERRIALLVAAPAPFSSPPPAAA